MVRGEEDADFVQCGRRRRISKRGEYGVGTIGD